jgi:hypothetical protein
MIIAAARLFIIEPKIDSESSTFGAGTPLYWRNNAFL